MASETQSNVQGYTGFNPKKIYMLGEKGSGLKPRGELQNYVQILNACKQSGKLFEDPQFSPENIVMGKAVRSPAKILWKRPREIISNAKMFSDGISRFDINQGLLGDCWFLAALANVAETKKYMELIAPQDQDFGDNYAGVFHFRFWQYGRWVEVVVDDRLPTYDNEPIFLHSHDKSEFWPCLLEKAYAKLYGSYEHLDGGLTSEALEDLTGGLSVFYDISPRPPIQLFDILYASYNKLSFMGCAIMSNKIEDKLPNGLYTKHAYSITDIAAFDCDGGFVRLLRIRNPWGEKEWKGDWSDNSKTWDMIPAELKSQLWRSEDDGEFWMSYEDFIKIYSFVEICYPNPDSYEITEEALKNWKCSMFDGVWVPNASAGGPLQSPKFFENPQYIINVEGEDPKKQHTIIVALMQKNRRLQGKRNNAMGFVVLQILSPPRNARFTKTDSPNLKPVGNSDLSPDKQVTRDMQLYPGSYCIVPCSAGAGEFLLRVYSESDYKITDNDDKLGYAPMEVDDEVKQQVLVDNDPNYNYFLTLAGQDAELDWKELKDILNKNNNNGFTKEVCRSLVALFDSDLSGKLNYSEAAQMMKQLAIWKAAFHKFDKDNSQTINGFELRETLKAAGYTVNNRTLHILMLRYGNGKGALEMEDFLLSVTKLKTIIDKFARKDKSTGANSTNVSLDEWVESAIYL